MPAGVDKMHFVAFYIIATSCHVISAFYAVTYILFNVLQVTPRITGYLSNHAGF